MKKTFSILAMFLMVLSFNFANAADDEIQDQGSSVTTIEQQEVQTIDSTMLYSIEDSENGTSNLRLSFTGNELKSLGWEFSIILPEWVEYNSIEKWSNLWEDDAVNASINENLLKIEFISETMTELNWEVFVINLTLNWNTINEILLAENEINEIFTDSVDWEKYKVSKFEENIIENLEVIEVNSNENSENVETVQIDSEASEIENVVTTSTIDEKAEIDTTVTTWTNQIMLLISLIWLLLTFWIFSIRNKKA